MGWVPAGKWAEFFGKTVAVMRRLFLLCCFHSLYWNEAVTARVVTGCGLIIAGISITESSHFVRQSPDAGEMRRPSR
ncbi:hypothetical protein SY88_05270 [Clostridiales bacterium PH28_bin88]|nr:hypothetical protein SY88_05270 [Clostridiales bacterium PH28_bin88]